MKIRKDLLQYIQFSRIHLHISGFTIIGTVVTASIFAALPLSHNTKLLLSYKEALAIASIFLIALMLFPIDALSQKIRNAPSTHGIISKLKHTACNVKGVKDSIIRIINPQCFIPQSRRELFENANTKQIMVEFTSLEKRLNPHINLYSIDAKKIGYLSFPVTYKKNQYDLCSNSYNKVHSYLRHEMCPQDSARYKKKAILSLILITIGIILFATNLVVALQKETMGIKGLAPTIVMALFSVVSGIACCIATFTGVILGTQFIANTSKFGHKPNSALSVRVTFIAQNSSNQCIYKECVQVMQCSINQYIAFCNIVENLSPLHENSATPQTIHGISNVQLTYVKDPYKVSDGQMCSLVCNQQGNHSAPYIKGAKAAAQPIKTLIPSAICLEVVNVDSFSQYCNSNTRDASMPYRQCLYSDTPNNSLANPTYDSSCVCASHGAAK